MPEDDLTCDWYLTCDWCGITAPLRDTFEWITFPAKGRKGGCVEYACPVCKDEAIKTDEWISRQGRANA